MNQDKKKIFVMLAFILFSFLTYRTASGEPAKEPLTITFTGDIMLGRQVGRAIQRAQDPTLPFREIGAETSSADISIGNLECVFVDTLITGTYNHDVIRFPAYKQAVDGLKLAGFDYCSLANNHSMDFGSEGVRSTIMTLEKNGIVPSGVNSNNPVIIDKKGWRVALFAFWVNHDSLWVVNSESGYVFNDTETVIGDVKQSKKSCDKVLLFLHWGREYYSTPTDSQRILAQKLLDSGADLIVGHGPHQIQEIEHKGDSVIAYSLGNCVFDQKYAETQKGLILVVRYQRVSERPEVTLLPIRISNDTFVTGLQETVP